MEAAESVNHGGDFWVVLLRHSSSFGVWLVAGTGRLVGYIFLPLPASSAAAALIVERAVKCLVAVWMATQNEERFALVSDVHPPAKLVDGVTRNIFLIHW